MSLLTIWCGVDPVIAVFGSESEENAAVAQWLNQRIDEGILPNEIAVFVRSEAQLSRGIGAVEGAGLVHKVLDQRVDVTFGRVSISPMHLAKGLEFRAVAVMACDDEVIPLARTNRDCRR